MTPTLTPAMPCPAATAKLAEEAREALQRKLLSIDMAPAAAPVVSPPPAAPPPPSAAEVAVGALRGELEGWKLVAENAQMTHDRVALQLKAEEVAVATQAAEKAHRQCP